MGTLWTHLGTLWQAKQEENHADSQCEPDLVFTQDGKFVTQGSDNSLHHGKLKYQARRFSHLCICSLLFV